MIIEPYKGKTPRLAPDVFSPDRIEVLKLLTSQIAISIENRNVWVQAWLYHLTGATHQDIPVIMLTARGEESDRVTGLEAGADDYMSKPVAIKELLARIRALLRRSRGFSQEETLQAGIIKLNIATHQVVIDGKSVHFGQTEYRLLKFFLQHPERVYSRGQLLDLVWGETVYVEERTVDVHILRLRKLLKPYGIESMVQTVRGAGYRFSQAAES